MDAGDVVTLDVGGCLYTTTRSTLTRFPQSALGTFTRDANGAYVIDGDGPTFRYVLNFLRRSKLLLPEDFKEWGLLSAEADFYQIPALQAAVVEARADARRAKTQKEFVEFTHAPTQWFKYTGSPEIFKQLPEVLRFFKSGGKKDEEIYQRLEKDGNITASYSYSDVVPAPNRMKLFQEISQLGFEMQQSPCASSEGEGDELQQSWLFARKIIE